MRPKKTNLSLQWNFSLLDRHHSWHKEYYVLFHPVYQNLNYRILIENGWNIFQAHLLKDLRWTLLYLLTNNDIKHMRIPYSRFRTIYSSNLSYHLLLYLVVHLPLRSQTVFANRHSWFLHRVRPTQNGLTYVLS